MNIADVKKVLAGVCIASLVSGAGIVTVASLQDATSAGAGNMILAS